jgi:hypothetical protein
LTGLDHNPGLGRLYSFAAALADFYPDQSLATSFFPASLALILVYGGHLLVRMHRWPNRNAAVCWKRYNRELESQNRRTHSGAFPNPSATPVSAISRLETAYQELTQTQEQLIHSEKMASLGIAGGGRRP